MKLNEQVRTPMGTDSRLAALLDQTLQAHARKVNAMASGTLSAIDGLGTAAPTTGTWAKGDIVRNSNPVQAGSVGNAYVVAGWICTTSGTPGVWTEVRTGYDVGYYGWRDITADITVRGGGASNPAWTQYNGTSIHAYAFAASGTTECWLSFHIPHDYVPGSEIHIHAHWSQTTADSGNSVEWYFDALYAKGFDQQAFPNAVTTVQVAQACSATVRQHMIAEVQLSTSGAIGGNAIEVDGIVLVRAYRNAAATNDTSTQIAFLHFVDLHYQSDNRATKNKAPNFYA
jgi:hypothetical protein